MLIQGTNVPIKLTFDANVSEMTKMVATLWNKSGKQFKKWELEDMTIEDNVAYLPLDEDETREFPKGKMLLEIKGTNVLNQTIFWEEATIEVKSRKDKDVDLIE